MDEPTVRDADPPRLVDDLWRPMAEEQLERAGRERTPIACGVAGVSMHPARLLGPLKGCSSTADSAHADADA